MTRRRRDLKPFVRWCGTCWTAESEVGAGRLPDGWVCIVVGGQFSNVQQFCSIECALIGADDMVRNRFGVRGLRVRSGHLTRLPRAPHDAGTRPTRKKRTSPLGGHGGATSRVSASTGAAA